MSSNLNQLHNVGWGVGGGGGEREGRGGNDTHGWRGRCITGGERRGEGGGGVTIPMGGGVDVLQVEKRREEWGGLVRGGGGVAEGGVTMLTST